MADETEFTDLVRRLRAGDQLAAEQLVRQYEPLIRREVRFQLQDRRLCRVFDSMDFCQSVLASFFVRAATGQYDLEQPKDLVGLLVTMARNKVAMQARKQYRQRRDARRTAATDSALGGVAHPDPTPSQQVAHRDLLDRVRAHLSEEELQLAELRRQGLSWAQIAEQMGGQAQARRMQLARAVERVVKELGLEEDDA
jgi:RNA polymerase sigma-70 factor (ECF subfamily)